ncbi:hypothetical protein [Oryza sativa Japonica Group]|uniref:Uncharacterized protein n=2 Tax=Oryza sativa subsp. japonica TaxID=39947 RepID=A0A979HLF5_ORYSJ|nr:hypothetical protein [Oryza sativa Japonica Group]BAS74684.1 Os01g0784867 [Oryza sativa Japonica Group]
MDCAAEAARPIRGMPVYSSAPAGGGHPFVGGVGDHWHDRNPDWSRVSLELSFDSRWRPIMIQVEDDTDLTSP